MKLPSKKATACILGGIALSSLTASALSLRQLYRRRPDLFPTERPWAVLPSPGEPKRVAVVYNPSKERAQAALNLIYRALSEAGWEPATMYETDIADPGFSMAKQALEDGAELVVAVGGDGTVREVASALKNTGVPLGIVPMGTGNLLARNLNFLVWDTASCVRFALFGQGQLIDMIHLETRLTSGVLDERDFLVMGGAGFDAQVMTDTDPRLKSTIGGAAYFVAAAKHLVERRHLVKITVNNRLVFHRRIRSVLVANCGEIQGGLNIASKTLANDGNLEVIVIAPRTLLSWVALCVQVITRRYRSTPVLEHVLGQRVTVDFLKSPQPVEVDGDIIGEAEQIQATVLPQVLVVNAPPLRPRF